MEEPWKILLYKTPQGHSPVREFILSLELNAQSKVRDSVKLLQGFGIKLGLPHVKKINRYRSLGTAYCRLRQYTDFLYCCK